MKLYCCYQSLLFFFQEITPISSIPFWINLPMAMLKWKKGQERAKRIGTNIVYFSGHVRNKCGPLFNQAYPGRFEMTINIDLEREI